MGFKFCFLSREVDGIERMEPVDAYIVLPHELFHAVYQCSKDKFQQMMTGYFSATAILQFWQQIKSLEDWSDHEIIHEMDDECLRRCIPITVHADGAEMFTNSEYYVWSWSSAFSAFGTISDCLMQKYPIAIVHTRYMEDPRVSSHY